MRSVTTRSFRLLFSKLPIDIQELAVENYKLWLKNNYHPSLHFKQIHTVQRIFSARVGISYRAVGIIEDATIIWFWIGTHDGYIRLIDKL